LEVVVRHNDPEHAEAAVEAALDEVARVEGVLSRFDRASETFRINRDAYPSPALASTELIRLLEACAEATARTAGRFDITAVCRRKLGVIEGPVVEVDPSSRRVRFTRPNMFLDFGGCGKGYALDRAASVLRSADIQYALLHGGTSSVLAFGTESDGGPWNIGVRNPFAQDGEIDKIQLTNHAISSSAAFHGMGNSEGSDILDPLNGMPLHVQSACVVIAGEPNGGFVSEVLSTALLATGREGAAGLLAHAGYNDVSAAWVENEGGSARLVWLTPIPTTP
jgi:thiamine biosynthesis lipoprotein